MSVWVYAHEIVWGACADEWGVLHMCVEVLCMCVWGYVHTCVYMCVGIYAHMYVGYVHACGGVCPHVGEYVHICVGGMCTCVCGGYVHMSAGVLGGQRHQISGARIMGSCEPPGTDAGTELGPLCVHMLVTPETSL